jgi:membrane-anchored protein YejM (alkaline phosphatase superfamily)
LQTVTAPHPSPEATPTLTSRSVLPLFGALQTLLWIGLGARFLRALAPESQPTALYLAGSWFLWLTIWGLLLQTGLRIFRRREILGMLLASFAAAAVDSYLYLDAGAYAAFRIHGGELLVRLAQAGAPDPAVLAWHPAHILSIVAKFALLQSLLAGLALAARRTRFRLPFPGWRAFLLAGLLFSTDRLYAAYTAHTGRHWLQGQTAAFPLYPNVSANRLIAKFARKSDPGAHRRALAGPGAALTTYDEKAAPIDRPKAPPNVVFILEESWRRDTLRPEKMPLLSALRSQFMVGEHHISGGNATRYGLFSFFYGLNPMAIDRFRADKRGPYFFQRLLQDGYDIHVLPGQPLDILGTKETIFVDVLKTLREPKDKRSALADVTAYKSARELIRTQPAEKPFFLFLFFSSTHARYDFLPGFGPNLYAKKKDGTSFPMAAAKRYENSLMYDDFLSGNIIRALMERPDWDNTIVVVTGDHGEEFQEHGHDMHGWSFNEEETAVPLLLHFPGQTTGATLHHLTSHVDIVPTVLRAMGDTRPIDSYSDGKLLTDTGNRLRYQQDWRAMSLFDGEERLTFYGSALEFWQPIAVTDDHEQPRDRNAFFLRHRDEIVAALRGNARFFR